MLTGNNTQSDTQSPKSKTKENREKFGLLGKPVVAVKAYRKDMDFDHEDVQTFTWLIITPDGTRIVTNSYDGRPGRNFDPASCTYSLPPEGDKRRSKMLKGYEEVASDQWPDFIVPVETAPVIPPVETPATPEAPKVEGETVETEELEVLEGDENLDAEPQV